LNVDGRPLGVESLLAATDCRAAASVALPLLFPFAADVPLIGLFERTLAGVLLPLRVDDREGVGESTFGTERFEVFGVAGVVAVGVLLVLFLTVLGVVWRLVREPEGELARDDVSDRGTLPFVAPDFRRGVERALGSPGEYN